MLDLNSILNKKSRVMVIDPSSAVRPVALSIFRAMGYKDIAGSENIKDILEKITSPEELPFSWVICPLGSNMEFNGFDFLKRLYKLKATKRPKVTFIIEEEEHLIPLASMIGGNVIYSKTSYDEFDAKRYKKRNSLYEGIRFRTKNSRNFFENVLTQS